MPPTFAARCITHIGFIFSNKVSTAIQSLKSILLPIYIYLKSGINDLGGISPKTIDWVNPDQLWPDINNLKKLIQKHNQELIPRLPVYPNFINKDWLDENIYEKVTNVINVNGYPKVKEHA